MKKFKLKFKGKKVKSDFEYSSNNKNFVMSLNEITKAQSRKNYLRLINFNTISIV